MCIRGNCDDTKPLALNSQRIFICASSELVVRSLKLQLHKDDSFNYQIALVTIMEMIRIFLPDPDRQLEFTKSSYDSSIIWSGNGKSAVFAFRQGFGWCCVSAWKRKHGFFEKHYSYAPEPNVCGRLPETRNGFVLLIIQVSTFEKRQK